MLKTIPLYRGYYISYINIFSEYKKVGSIKRATDIITDIIFCKCVSLFSDSYINVG